MSREHAIRELKIALADDNKHRFIAILEEFRATTAIVLYLSVIEQWEGIDAFTNKAREWVVERVGGKTATKLMEKSE